MLKTGEPAEAELSPWNQEHWPASQGSWLSRARPLKDENGHIIGAVEAALNLTESKRAEQERVSMQQQLLHLHKLEAVGQLAAGIAHEINTPIQFIEDNMRFISGAMNDLWALIGRYEALYGVVRGGGIPDVELDEVAEAARIADLVFIQEEIPKALEQSLEGLERVAKLVRAMKSFSHPDSAEMVASDLNAGIMDTITISRNEWKYVAELHTDLDSDLPMVICHPGSINQVLMNLIINAAHAIGSVLSGATDQKGLITVQTRGKGDRVEIRVSDTGIGIPEAIRHRIFEPFFTTKPVGKGTGQGLSLSRNIVERDHNGLISFESESGKGTTFIIQLPIEASGRGAPA